MAGTTNWPKCSRENVAAEDMATRCWLVGGVDELLGSDWNHKQAVKSEGRGSEKPSRCQLSDTPALLSQPDTTEGVGKVEAPLRRVVFMAIMISHKRTTTIDRCRHQRLVRVPFLVHRASALKLSLAGTIEYSFPTIWTRLDTLLSLQHGNVPSDVATSTHRAFARRSRDKSGCLLLNINNIGTLPVLTHIQSSKREPRSIHSTPLMAMDEYHIFTGPRPNDPSIMLRRSAAPLLSTNLSNHKLSNLHSAGDLRLTACRGQRHRLQN